MTSQHDKKVHDKIFSKCSWQEEKEDLHLQFVQLTSSYLRLHVKRRTRNTLLSRGSSPSHQQQGAVFINIYKRKVPAARHRKEKKSTGGTGNEREKGKWAYLAAGEKPALLPSRSGNWRDSETFSLNVGGFSSQENFSYCHFAAVPPNDIPKRKK